MPALGVFAKIRDSMRMDLSSAAPQATGKPGKAKAANEASRAAASDAVPASPMPARSETDTPARPTPSMRHSARPGAFGAAANSAMRNSARPGAFGAAANNAMKSSARSTAFSAPASRALSLADAEREEMMQKELARTEHRAMCLEREHYRMQMHEEAMENLAEQTKKREERIRQLEEELKRAEQEFETARRDFEQHNPGRQLRTTIPVFQLPQRSLTNAAAAPSPQRVVDPKSLADKEASVERLRMENASLAEYTQQQARALRALERKLGGAGLRPLLKIDQDALRRNKSFSGGAATDRASSAMRQSVANMAGLYNSNNTCNDLATARTRPDAARRTMSEARQPGKLVSEVGRYNSLVPQRSESATASKDSKDSAAAAAATSSAVDRGSVRNLSALFESAQTSGIALEKVQL